MIKSFSPSDNLHWVILALIILVFTFRSFSLFSLKSAPLVDSQPQPNGYRSDEFVFLRTFYLIRSGDNYYHAFNDSVVNDIRKGVLSKDVFAWRLPTIFYIWTILARDGVGIGILFIILSSLSLAASYFLNRKFLPPLPSLIAPILLAPYFLDAYEYRTSFLFTEWWGMFFLFFGITFYFYRKMLPAAIFLILAVLTREFNIIPLVAMTFVAFILQKDRRFFVTIVGIFCLAYLTHLTIVGQQAVQANNSNALARLHPFSFAQFQKEIAFSMRQYPLLNFRLPLVIFVAATIGLVYQATKSLKIKKGREFYLLAAAAVLPLALIIPFSGVIFNDYWGIIFMPLIITFSPLISLVIEDSLEGIFLQFK